MHKTSTSLFLSLLMVGHFPAISCSDKSFGHSFWDGVGIAAAAIAVGVGAAKLASWCFTETNPQLIGRGEAEYNKALGYGDLIRVYEDCYYEGVCQYESSDERLLYTLATRLFDRGISQTVYVADVIRSEKQLRSLSSTLKERITHLQGTYLERAEIRQLQQMRDLLSRVDAHIPRLSPFARYVDKNQRYFGLYECEARLYKYYDAEMRIAKQGMYADVVMYDVRQAVMWRYAGVKYPLTKFVAQMNSDLSSLKSHMRSLVGRYPERHAYAQQLCDALEWIRRVVVADERYQQELWQIEQERLERLRVEALQEQARIEQMKLDAMRRQNSLLRESNRLQQEQLYVVGYQEPVCDVGVTVNLTL